MTMRLFTSLLLLSLLSLSAPAENIIIESDCDNPVAGAAIFNSAGVISTISDIDGLYTAPSVSDYPIRVTALGYDDLIVETPTDTLRLVPQAILLPNVNFSPDPSRVVMAMRDYVKSVFTMTTETDTIRMLQEGNVEFLIADKSVKGFKSPKYPRILHTRIVSRVVHKDSVKNTKVEGENDLFTLRIQKVFPENLEIPQELLTPSRGIVTRRKEWGNSSRIEKSPEGFVYTVDHLADKKNHEWVPTFTRLLGMTTRIQELQTTFRYAPVDSGVTVIPPYNLESMSNSIRGVMKGKMVKVAFNDEVEFMNFVEIYPYETIFLTVEEAKKRQKEASDVKSIFVPEIARRRQKK